MSRRPRAGLRVARILGGLLLLFVVFVSGPAAESQGLGDAATQERERRDRDTGAPGKVFTNDDLPETADEPAEPGSGEGEGGTASAPEGSPEPGDDFRERRDREREERALLERDWRARFAEARAKLREAEARGWREVVRTDFYQGIPVQMKVKEFVETEEYRQAKKDLADLEEEFRRTGHPPGWARE